MSGVNGNSPAVCDSVEGRVREEPTAGGLSVGDRVWEIWENGDQLINHGNVRCKMGMGRRQDDTGETIVVD